MMAPRFRVAFLPFVVGHVVVVQGFGSLQRTRSSLLFSNYLDSLSTTTSHDPNNNGYQNSQPNNNVIDDLTRQHEGYLDHLNNNNNGATTHETAAATPDPRQPERPNLNGKVDPLSSVNSHSPPVNGHSAPSLVNGHIGPGYNDGSGSEPWHVNGNSASSSVNGHSRRPSPVNEHSAPTINGAASTSSSEYSSSRREQNLNSQPTVNDRFKPLPVNNGHSQEPSSFNGHSESRNGGAAYLTNNNGNGAERKIAGGTLINEQERLSHSSFPISPSQLIELAQKVLGVSCGLDDHSVLSEKFKFEGPIMRMDLTEYLRTHASYEILNAFADYDNQYYNFHVDPFEFNRVWYTIRPVATHTGLLNGKKPTGKRIELPPQAQSMTFDESGKVVSMTVGYVMDNRVGNTGGLGGTVGLFKGVGL